MKPLHVMGNLLNVEFLPFNIKYPVVLKRNNAVPRLTVNEYHEKENHIAGTSQTSAVL